MISERIALSVIVAVTCSRSVVSPATAQEWPTKQPIRVIVPLGAGSAVDIIPRTVMEQVSQQIGQSIIVENRTGGGGSIGAAAVAKADPDGYTVLVHSNAHTIAPAVLGKLSYDVVNDFAGITPLERFPKRLNRGLNEAATRRCEAVAVVPPV